MSTVYELNQGTITRPRFLSFSCCWLLAFFVAARARRQGRLGAGELDRCGIIIGSHERRLSRRVPTICLPVLPVLPACLPACLLPGATVRGSEGRVFNRKNLILCVRRCQEAAFCA